jgi:hypothetical protein
VLESLARGKQVIYSQPLKHCIHVSTQDEMNKAVQQLKDQLNKEGKLMNVAGQKFIEEEFNRDKILSTLIAEFAK